MNTNFDEKQGFEDLRGVLNHIYQFANYYYAEMTAAQKLNAEKDSEIAKKISDIANLKSGYEEKLRAKDAKISALENKIIEQGENFKNHLTEYGNYNLQLTRQLEERKIYLENQKRQIDARAAEIQTAQEKLKSDRAALDKERADFDAEKNFVKEKLSNYEALQKASENFDAEKISLQQKISALEKNIQTKDEEYNAQITTLTEERDRFKTKSENLQRELDAATTSSNDEYNAQMQALVEEKDRWKNKAENLQRQLDEQKPTPAENFNPPNNDGQF